MKKFLIASLILVAIIFVAFLWLKDLDYNKIASDLLIQELNKRINGSAKLQDLKLDFQAKNLLLEAQELLILDQDGNQVLELHAPSVLLGTKSIFAPLLKFHKIAAEDLNITARRDKQGKWNFQKLIRKRKRKFKFRFKELDFSKIDIEIEDAVTANQIQYQGIRLNLKHKAKDKKYIVDLETTESDKNDDYIKILGDLNTAGLKDLLAKTNSLDVQIIRLDAVSINFFSTLFNLDSDTELQDFINQHLRNSELSLIAKLSTAESNDKHISIDSTLFNCGDIAEVDLDTKLKLGDDLYFEDFRFRFDDSQVNLAGTINQWRDDKAKLDLDLSFEDLNMFDLVDSFPELETYVPSFILEIFNFLHGNDYMNGKIRLSSTIDNPEILASLKLNSPNLRLVKARNRKVYPRIINIEKEIIAKLNLYRNKLFINEFKMPIDYSTLLITGSVALDKDSFEINMQGEDLPLAKLRPVVAEMPFLKAYRGNIARSSIKGYATVDLDIGRLVPEGTAEPETMVKGTLKLAKLNYRYADYPLTFRNMAANLGIDGDDITIHHIHSFIQDPKPTIGADIFEQPPKKTYIEGRGNFNLAEKGNYNLEIASPKIDAQTLVYSRILNLITAVDQLQIQSAAGALDDIFISINASAPSYTISGRMDIEGVGIETASQGRISGIKGSVSLDQGRIKADNLSFAFNPESLVSIDGSINQDLTSPKMKFKAESLAVANVLHFFDPEHDFKIDPRTGYLDLDLDIDNEEVLGNISFYDLSFKYNGSKYFNHLFSNLSGNMILDNDLTIANTSGNYGATKFQNLAAKVINYKSDDKDYDLSLDMDLVVDEVYDFLPRGIKRFLKARGTLPMSFGLKGNKLKKNVAVEANLDKLDSFSFAEWLLMKPVTAVKLISNFTITPQLIVSDDSKLVFSTKRGTSLVKTKVKSLFQIEDWSKTSDLSYYVSFKTVNKNGDPDLSVIEPHIVSLKPLNLDIGRGRFNCDTFGNPKERQTICEFKIADAIAKKYGIGDLKGENIKVGLLSIANDPLKMQFKVASGDWNTIPYNKLKFDLAAIGKDINISNLRARVMDGVIRASTSFNTKSLDSKFKMEGQNLPAHELAQGVWGLGSEVPEGLVSGVFEGTTSGILPEPMFANLVGSANVVLKDGKLSQLVTMQKILTAVNTLDNFDLNNVFQTLVTLKGGYFNHAITSLIYDHAKVSSEKALLKAPQIELNLNGYVDYANDQLWIKGKGLIPKKSKSILQGIGIGKVNLGNLVSMADISDKGSKQKRFFDFMMVGPVEDIDKSVESLKSNFSWI